MGNEKTFQHWHVVALTVTCSGLTAFGCTKSDSIGVVDNPDSSPVPVAPVGETGDQGTTVNPFSGVPEPYQGVVDGVCTVPSSITQYKYAKGYTPDPAVQQTVRTLMSKMTLLDKADQMRGMPYGSAGKLNFNDVQRSKDTKSIRGFRYRDGSRGMNLAEDMDGATPNAATVNGTAVGFSTAFPVSMARGAAFDLDLEYAIGEAIGDEMMAAKQTVLLAPHMNLLRNPLWGRAQETYGEDPFHLGRMASAMTWGIQQHIAANAKEFMAYDIENGRDFNDSLLDEQTLREIYGRHFRMVVKDGGVASVMASYNMVNGVKSAENAHTLTDVLRSDFGFQGFVLSEWWGMRPESNVDGVDTSTLKSYALSSMKAGLDVEVPWSLDYGQLESIVQNKAGLTEADINASVARILEQKVRFNAHNLSGAIGLGTAKTTYKNGRIGNDAGHLALAAKAALESMVLLKNDNHTLPIAASTQKVAVLGATVPILTKNDGKATASSLNFATDVNTGDLGSSRVFPDPAKGIGPFAGIQAAAPSGVTVVSGSGPDAALDADFIIVVAGLTAGDEGEEYTLAGDRRNLALDGKQLNPQSDNIQNNLIRAAAALGKPMVVVLEGGSVIDMPWLSNVPAVVMAWYPGMVGGKALGQLLFGQASFSGKLPFTWGKQLSDYPVFKDDLGSTSFDYYVGYRYFDHNNITPLFPFGYGLSYATFEYRKLEVPCAAVTKGAAFPVTVTVANTGTMAADETVMVFVSFPNTTARRAAKEIKGFERVSLQAGEEKAVTVFIRTTDLDYWDTPSSQWVIESDRVNIMAGPNASTLPLTASIVIQ